MPHQIIRAGDGWDARFAAGLSVTGIRLELHFQLHIGPGGVEVYSPGELMTDDDIYHVHAWSRANLGRVAELLGLVVRQIYAADSGELTIRFTNDWELLIPVSHETLGWSVYLYGSRLRSLPGGGVRADLGGGPSAAG
ncbi:DUF6188 family protein [Nocardia sp. NPDC059180]|uniref:DUF6188 family protein n=1 Tax=Nocardia sp. NPDC059180 TaxID=3346761 RepID=UPI0036A03713